MSEARPILFGKLPRHGDFVARNLGGAARDAWDHWASQGIAEARAALGEAFETEHEAIPPWRFVDGPGAFGPGWRAGCLAPSIDAAGRRFMIVLAVEGLSPAEAGASGEAIAEAMEELIYCAFEQGWDADSLVGAAQPALAGVRAEDGESPRPRGWTLGGPDHPERSLAGGLEALLAQMLAPQSWEATQ